MLDARLIAENYAPKWCNPTVFASAYIYFGEMTSDAREQI
jgi:hypothetical protein